MIEENNHIDQLLNSEIPKMNFEFKDTYWSEMEGLLNQQKRKKIAFWWWISSSAAILFIIGLAGWMFMNVNQTKDKTQFAQENLIQQKKIKTNNKNLNLTKEVKAIQNKKNTLSNSNLNNKLNSTTINNNNSNENQIAQTVNEYNKQKTVAVSTAKLKTKTPKDNQKQNVPTNASSSIKSSTNSDVIVVFDKSTEIKTIGCLAPNNVKRLSKLSPSINISEQLNTSPIPVSTIKNHVIEHTFLLQAGAGYSTSGFSKSSYGGEQFHLGALYQLEKGRWGFRTGLIGSWTSVAGLHYYDREKVYGFTSKNVSSELHYRSLVNISIPIEALFTCQKSTFGLGISANILATTSARFKGWGDETTSSSLQYGYRANLKPISLGVMFNYAYQITTRWAIGASLNYSLSPISANSDRKLNSDETRLFSGQVFFQYKLNYFRR